MIVAGGKIDRVEADGEIMCFISNFFIYSRRKGNMDELLQEWDLLLKGNYLRQVTPCPILKLL